MPITGGCLCGNVRYEIAAEGPTAARQAGGGSAVFSGRRRHGSTRVFNKDPFATPGETRVFTSIADSGAVMRRSFCSTCGTPLFSEAEPRRI